MQIGRKGDSLRTCIKHDATYPVFADGARQSVQSARVVASQSCGSLDFDAHYLPGTILQHDVNFTAGNGSPVK